MRLSNLLVFAVLVSAACARDLSTGPVAPAAVPATTPTPKPSTPAPLKLDTLLALSPGPFDLGTTRLHLLPGPLDTSFHNSWIWYPSNLENGVWKSVPLQKGEKGVLVMEPTTTFLILPVDGRKPTLGFVSDWAPVDPDGSLGKVEEFVLLRITSYKRTLKDSIGTLVSHLDSAGNQIGDFEWKTMTIVPGDTVKYKLSSDSSISQSVEVSFGYRYPCLPNDTIAFRSMRGIDQFIISDDPNLAFSAMLIHSRGMSRTTVGFEARPSLVVQKLDYWFKSIHSTVPTTTVKCHQG